MATVWRLRRVAIIVLVAGALPIGAGGGSALEAEADKQSEPAEPPNRAQLKVLFPLDKGVLESGEIEVMAVSRPPANGAAKEPRLEVDGERLPWKPYEPPAYVANLKLDPGEHAVTVGDQTLAVFVLEDGAEPPAGWCKLQSHYADDPDSRDCSVCHETASRDGRFAVGEWLGYTACSECHDSVEFAAAHSHTEQPLQQCGACHALHGSDRSGLLTAPARTLCAECHD